jgi:type IV pilus assembly protein PilA
MSSIRCSHCGFVSFATSECCKQCGNDLSSLRAGAHGAQDNNNQQGYAAPSYGAFEGQTKRRAGLAVASLVLGIVGFFTFGIIGVGALTGIILGVLALARASRQPDEYGGRGMAIGGIVLNVLSIVLIVPVGMVAAIAIPNLVASRRAANEAAALSSLRVITQAENTYYAGSGAERGYATLEELKAGELIDETLAAGTKSGYHFSVESHPNYFVVNATPVAYPSSGSRSFFYISNDDQIRAGDKHGAEADADDPPLGNEPRYGRIPN